MSPSCYAEFGEWEKEEEGGGEGEGRGGPSSRLVQLLQEDRHTCRADRRGREDQTRAAVSERYCTGLVKRRERWDFSMDGQHWMTTPQVGYRIPIPSASASAVAGAEAGAEAEADSNDAAGLTSSNDGASKEASHGNGRKRPRSSMACTACRKRKSKCDGGQPTCGHCLKTQSQCVYVDDDRRRKQKVGSGSHSGTQEELLELQRKYELLQDAIRSGRPAEYLESAAAPAAAATAPAPAPAPAPTGPPAGQVYSKSASTPPLPFDSTSYTAEDSMLEPPPPPNLNASLDENDLLDPVPAGMLDSIKTGQATPGGPQLESLAQQLSRRDARMSLADDGRLRWYGATSSRHLSLGGHHFRRNNAEGLANSLNDRCRRAIIEAGFPSTAIEEDIHLQERLVR